MAIPAYQRYHDGAVRGPNDPVFWALDREPPNLETRVEVLCWGSMKKYTGTVVGYSTSAGWLMIKVKLDDRPDWHRKQNPDRTIGIFAGIELEW